MHGSGSRRVEDGTEIKRIAISVSTSLACLEFSSPLLDITFSLLYSSALVPFFRFGTIDPPRESSLNRYFGRVERRKC